MEAGALSERFTAVHFTHTSAEDTAEVGAAGATACLCPTTERDLADGVGAAQTIADAGAHLSLGSDSHAVIDHFAEMRATDLDQRLVTGERGLHSSAELLRAATGEGHRSIGWPEAGAIAPGAIGDLVTVSLDGVRLAGVDAEAPSTPPCSQRRRPTSAASSPPGARWCATVRTRRLTLRLSCVRRSRGVDMSAFVIDNIGLLATNDPELGDGPLGMVRTWRLVFEDGRVAAVDRAGVGRRRRLRR